MRLQVDDARVLRIATAVREAGGRALLVGGLVRDALLAGAMPAARDVDLEVYGVSAEGLGALLREIGPVTAVGAAFTVYKVGDIDVSLPRRDSKTGHGHRRFTVTGDPTMTVAEAARRRDFTIDAILCDPLTGEVIDPVGGVEDLRARRLRAVDPGTFGGDSLRVLRAMQLAARFDLSIDPATTALCRRIPLDDLPAERIQGEVEKLLLRPGQFHAARARVGNGAFRRLSLRCELDLLYRVAKADALGRHRPGAPEPTAEAQEWFLERARALEVTREAPRPLLLGRHLLAMGLQPGPRLGEITRKVYELQLDGAVTTLNEALAAARRLRESTEG